MDMRAVGGCNYDSQSYAYNYDDETMYTIHNTSVILKTLSTKPDNLQSLQLCFSLSESTVMFLCQSLQLCFSVRVYSYVSLSESTVMFLCQSLQLCFSVRVYSYVSLSESTVCIYNCYFPKTSIWRVVLCAGTNDSYVTIHLGKEKYQTSVKDKSLAPEWNEECDL